MTTKYPFKFDYDLSNGEPFKLTDKETVIDNGTTLISGPERNENTLNHEFKDFICIKQFENDHSYVISCTNGHITIWSTKRIVKNKDGNFEF